MRFLVIADENAFPVEVWDVLIAGHLPPLLQKRPASAVYLYKDIAANERMTFIADHDALSETTISRLHAEAGKTYAIPKKPGTSVEVVKRPTYSNRVSATEEPER